MDLNLIKPYFTPKRVLDIGANVGGWFAVCKAHFPDSYVFSIEANEECRDILKTNNPDSTIALLAKDEEIYDFYMMNNVPYATGNSIYKELTPHYNDATTYTVKKQGVMLDKLLKGQTFDLIKMDVQGAELDIIKGGINICKQAKGMILEVAVGPYNQDSPLYDEVVEYMDSIGFKKELILSDLMNGNQIGHHDIFFLNKTLA